MYFDQTDVVRDKNRRRCKGTVARTYCAIRASAVSSRHPELMYTIAAPLVVVYIGTLEVGMPELNEDKNGWILTWLNG